MAPSNGHGAPHTTSGIWTILPIVVLLAYIAFLLTGFGRMLGAVQAVPVYLFFCLVLLTLQQSITQTHSFWRLFYVLVTSAFAVIYAGEFVFNVHTLDFTRNPATYVFGELALLVAFIIDMVGRTRHRARTNPAARISSSADAQRNAITRFGTLATDIAGLAAFFFGSAFLLDLLGGQSVPRALGIHLGSPYVVVNLNTMLHVHWASPINLLEGLNLVLGLAATGVALALLVMAGALLPSANDGGRVAIQRSFWQTLRETLTQVIGTLRLVLSPLIWLVPAFALAKFAQHTAHYFNLAAETHSSIVDLFNPFSPTGVRYWQTGIGSLLLGLVAVAAMVLAVTVIEQEPALMRRTLRTFRLAGRATALTWAFFMYSLALINAVVVLLGLTKAEPFQVGAPGLIALLIGALMLIYESRQLPAQPKGPVAPQAAPPMASPNGRRELIHH